MKTEKKLTAMQEFLENIRKEHGLCFSNNVVDNYLEKEKQQIIDACNAFGNLNGVDEKDFKQYYNETYKN